MFNFFNQSLDLLCIAGFDGYFKHLNLAWSVLLGWTNEELQAKPFLDFVHPDDLAATIAVTAQMETGSATICFENRYRCKDGSWKWLSWSARPFLDRQEIYAIARDIAHDMTRQKRLELKILVSGENEQQRISRDLHDGLGPHLTAIRYAATFLANELRQNHPSSATKADQISIMAGDAVTIARDLARGIFPVQLDGLGLAAALEDLAETTSRQSAMLVSFVETGDVWLTDATIDLHLYRIAQEALNNAAKHSAARHVSMILHHRENLLRLTVADDGQGLSAMPHDASGMGMEFMHYRARALGGELSVDSLPDQGAIVTCIIPILSSATASL